MTVKLRRPILIGGIGLSFSLWLLERLYDSVSEVAEVGLLGAIAVGASFWFFQQKTNKPLVLSPLSPLERETVEKAIAQAEVAIAQLEAEATTPEAYTSLRQQLTQLTAGLDRKELRLAVIGGKSVGKSSLIEVLQQNWIAQQPQKINLEETAALFTATDLEATLETAALDVAKAADIVLFVTAGDLTEKEFEILQPLVNNQRVLLVFNKQDQYSPEERSLILHQLQKRVENVVAIAATPAVIKVIKHHPDGDLREYLEQPAPQVDLLTERLEQILTQEEQQLIWASSYRAATGLKTEAKTALNKLRRDRALPVIEQYQWIVAATAFANPVPALDLLATAAINAQLVIDLGKIYQQKFSFQQAQTVATAMGSLMVKLGLVELSTQAIAGILKSNAFTFIAGGAVQGVSAAYLTRLAGLSLIEYFQAQEAATMTAEAQFFNLEQLKENLQKVFQANQRTAFLQTFVKQAVTRILPESPQPELTGGETV